MICSKSKCLPHLFVQLREMGCITEANIYTTSDGFSAVSVTLADILAHRDITCVPGRCGDQLDCSLFFDDWYLYAVSDGEKHTYSLFKMREQEYDAKQGRNADGDTPGVSIPFISMRTEVLLECLRKPTSDNRRHLNEEINRVVAYGGQHHDKTLKRYFVRSEAQGPYVIAKLYTDYIAAQAKNGSVSVPERYAEDYHKRGLHGRVQRFIEENNRCAEALVCDHERIYVADPLHPTERERLAILASHTGNVSFYSFAAEVQFHARFLTRWAKFPIPGVGRSPYASAIRADLSIGDAEFTGPSPYYRNGSRIVQRQYRCHKDDVY